VFEVEQPEDITVTLFTTSGVRLMRIYTGHVERGSFQQTFNIGSLPEGLYIVTINAGNKIIGTERLVIIR